MREVKVAGSAILSSEMYPTFDTDSIKGVITVFNHLHILPSYTNVLSDM
jgi:hypothetical protein